MIGTISNAAGNPGRQVYTEIKSLERKIDGLEVQVNNIQTEVDSLDNNITTENLESTNITSQSINTNAILGKSIETETLNSESINSDDITSDNINADNIKASSITSDEIHGQIKDRQSIITSDTGSIKVLDSEDIDVDLLKAKAATITELTLEDSLETSKVTATNVNADNITGTAGNITTLQSAAATLDEISNTSITSHTATIDSIDAEEAEIDEANVNSLKADEIETGIITGKEVINLDPQKITEQDYYLLKIKKGFDSLHLFVEDSLDINIINAYTPSGTTNGTPLVISHCHSVSEIVLYSKDADYYYIEISPNNTNELHYSYKAHEKIQDLVTASLNEEVELDWYYKTERTSEIIFLGSADEEDMFNYQFTVLGKLNAPISPTFDNYVFDDITINKNLYTKDFFNEETQDWTYKKGEVNDYLSNIEDYIDEETGEQKTRVDWRKRVDFRNPNQYIVTTEDSTEDVEVDGTKIGERVVKANVNTLTDLGTLRNYNGQWITSEPEPTGRMVPPYSIVFEQTEYTDIPDNEWKVLFSDPMDFSKTPEIDKTMAAMVKISDYGQNTQEKYTHYVRLHESINLDRFLINRGWTKTTDQGATVYTASYTTDDGWIEVLYGHKYGKSNYNLINKVKVESNNTFFYYNDTLITSYVSHCIYRYSNISTSVQVTGTVEMTPATTVNPITKLGIVDEGTWVAGDVTTPNLKVNDSTVLNTTTTINNDLHITEKVLDFGGTNYDVWDYANDNMNWVEE